MKVAVITRHAIINYGSLLQCLATQVILENLGYECEIIDYVRVDETYKERERTILARKSNWNNNIFKRTIYLAIRQPESIITGKRFEKMQHKYLHLTRRYSSKEELLSDKPIADCYLTGSDQVWGPVENGTYDDSYLLSFTDEKDKRLSYAASFGHTDFSMELDNYYKKWLCRYNSILVREDSAVRKIRELGFNARQVIDPTLLVPSEFWRQLANSGTREKGYILVYQLHNNDRLGRYAKEIARRKGLKLVRVSQAFHQMTRPGKFIGCPDIKEFISLIDNADCMITDSFHGTAFAINLNTPFIEILPNNNTGTRNMSILKLTGLTDRILGEEDDYNIINKKIDFDRVNKIIENKRNGSLLEMKKMLASAD